MEVHCLGGSQSDLGPIKVQKCPVSLPPSPPAKRRESLAFNPSASAGQASPESNRKCFLGFRFVLANRSARSRGEQLISEPCAHCPLRSSVVYSCRLATQTKFTSFPTEPSLSTSLQRSSKLITIFLSTLSFMLPRQPKKSHIFARRGLKFFLIAEGIIFFSSYTLWAACNRSQSTRKFFHDKPYLNFILEFYYRIGESRGEHFRLIRENDYNTWRTQLQLSSSSQNEDRQ